MIYSNSYKVTTCQVDMSGKVTVPALCGMMQETASRYCYDNRISLVHLNPKNLTWMIINQYVDFENLPGWLEQVNVSTWPRIKRGLRSLRDYSITDESGQTVANSVTTWVLLDTETRRPVRMDDTVKHLTAVEDSVFETEKRIRVDLPDADFKEKLFNVRYSDLDVNGHVNNIKYIEWCLDSIPGDFQKNHRVKNLTIEFIHETYADNKVAANTAFQGPVSYHELINKTTGNTVCKASMTWKIS